jgi:hypothetical protein
MPIEKEAGEMSREETVGGVLGVVCVCECAPAPPQPQFSDASNSSAIQVTAFIGSPGCASVDARAHRPHCR